MRDLHSQPGVVDVEVLRGAACAASVPELVVEVPHGATDLADFERLRDQMRGPLPERLEDFFLVNTDVGAFEVGRRLAELWVAGDASRSAVVLRCRIPRTLIDANRVVDGEFADGMTPGIPPYVTNAEDRRLLVELYRSYVEVVEPVIDSVCGAGGRCLLPHSCAPRTVGIERVDENIVANLHAVYRPEVVEDWPLRPEIDLILNDENGVALAPPAAGDALARELVSEGFEVAIGASYYLHPSTMARVHSDRHPGSVLCFEVRRDLLVEDFVPFRVMHVDPARVERVCVPMARALFD